MIRYFLEPLLLLIFLLTPSNNINPLFFYIIGITLLTIVIILHNEKSIFKKRKNNRYIYIHYGLFHILLGFPIIILSKMEINLVVINIFFSFGLIALIYGIIKSIFGKIQKNEEKNTGLYFMLFGAYVMFLPFMLYNLIYSFKMFPFIGGIFIFFIGIVTLLNKYIPKMFRITDENKRKNILMGIIFGIIGFILLGLSFIKTTLFINNQLDFRLFGIGFILLGLVFVIFRKKEGVLVFEDPEEIKIDEKFPKYKISKKDIKKFTE